MTLPDQPAPVRPEPEATVTPAPTGTETPGPEVLTSTDSADPAGPGPGAATPPPRRTGRLVALILLAVLGLAGIAGGGAALAGELTRKATSAEVSAALAKEIASRWQRRPAGKIFPATLSYKDTAVNAITGLNGTLTANLAGIAPLASCRTALGPGAVAKISSLGCRTTLRATYVNASGSYAVTVVICVMASPSAATQGFVDLAPLSVADGPYPLPFSGTITSSFGDGGRAASAVQEGTGPYLFMYTAGYTDGLPGTAAAANPALSLMGTGLLSDLQTTLEDHANPCTMKDIHC